VYAISRLEDIIDKRKKDLQGAEYNR
jgi:hypothetical protein